VDKTLPHLGDYTKTQEMEGDGSGKYLVPNLGRREVIRARKG
jgi:hypothetical protein